MRNVRPNRTSWRSISPTYSANNFVSGELNREDAVIRRNMVIEEYGKRAKIVKKKAVSPYTKKEHEVYDVQVLDTENDESLIAPRP